MIPEDVTKREQYIFDQVVIGNFDAKWSELNFRSDEHDVRLLVMEDALKVEGIRVNVSATLAQKLADIFDASLPTAQIVDAIYAYATRKAFPRPMPISSSTSSMKKHSEEVEKQIGSSPGLAATVGKHWVLDKQIENKSQASCNYGWHFSGSSFQGIKGFAPASSFAGSNVRVIQPNAIAHDRLHVDYSQICQLVSQRCWIDGKELRFEDVIKDEFLAKSLSHQGPLKIDRQTGTQKIQGQLVLLPTIITGDQDANV